MDATREEIFMNSLLMAASFRGLTKKDAEQPENGFRYINCLGREYFTNLNFVESVEFDISRHGNFTKTLKFDVPVSEKTAIELINKYLSRPLTEKYFNKIKEDTLYDDCSWDEVKEHYKCRGDCLSDARFLEGIHIKNGVMSFFIGS